MQVPLIRLNGQSVKSTLWTAYTFNPRIHAQLDLTRYHEDKKNATPTVVNLPGNCHHVA